MIGCRNETFEGLIWFDREQPFKFYVDHHTSKRVVNIMNANPCETGGNALNLADTSGKC